MRGSTDPRVQAACLQVHACAYAGHGAADAGGAGGTRAAAKQRVRESIRRALAQRSSLETGCSEMTTTTTMMLMIYHYYNRVLISDSDLDPGSGQILILEPQIQIQDPGYWVL